MNFKPTETSSPVTLAQQTLSEPISGGDRVRAAHAPLLSTMMMGLSAKRIMVEMSGAVT